MWGTQVKPQGRVPFYLCSFSVNLKALKKKKKKGVWKKCEAEPNEEDCVQLMPDLRPSPVPARAWTL